MKRMNLYFKTCEYCGAALDPGERCDCRKAKAARRPHINTKPKGEETHETQQKLLDGR